MVEITEFICILNVVKSTVLVETFTVYSMQFPPTVRRTWIGSSFYGRTPTTICEHVTMRPTGMLLRVKKRIVFVPLWNFPGNPSAIWPNSFDIQFSQRSIFILLLNAFTTCNELSPLCLGQKRSWLGTMVTVNPQFVWPCCTLWLQLFGPCGLFTLVLQ